MRPLSIKRISKAVCSMLMMSTIFLGVIPPVATALADDGESKVTSAYSDYAGDSKETTEVLGKFTDEGIPTRGDGFNYLFSRIVTPQYMYDVQSAALGSMPSNVDKSLINNGVVCDKNSPKNLIGSNCNIPNFSAQLGQTVMQVLSPGGVENADRTSSKALFGWGVPANIPGGSVPTDLSSTSNKYTGLELYGYNIPYTQYYGEWDNIVPSTKARMLSNFGLMDKISLTGTSIWDGMREGASTFVNGLSWNPTTWLGNIQNTFEQGATSSLVTIIDTSDANVVASRAWVRSGNSVSNSFYGVGVLSDKQILDSANIRVANRYKSLLTGKVNNNAELKEVLAMETPPDFKFDPNLETEESKAARKKANDTNAAVDKYNKEADAYNAAAKEENAKIDEENSKEKDKNKQKPHKEMRPKKDKVEVPAKKIVPEKEQFKNFKKEDSRVAKGESVGISCSDKDDYKAYKACWASKWTSYRDENFNAKSSVLTQLVDETQKEVLAGDEYADPTKAISHYVCLDSNGNLMKDANGNYQYLYLKENSGSTEYVNKACPVVRPTIQGGFFGNGYPNEKVTDTRHISNIDGPGITRIIPALGDLSSLIETIGRGIAKFSAQTINEMMNLAYSPLMEKLGISTLVKSSLQSFKGTIFYPLTIIAVSIAGFFLLLGLLRTGSAQQFLMGLLSLAIIFFLGVVMMESPDKVVNFFDRVPAQAEQGLSNIILNSSDPTGICSTASKGKSNGIRSAQCNIWATTIYQPWVFGEFGTSPDSLDTKEMKNSNGALVGTAEVNMGGNTKVNNWALYQLSLMKSGTITTDDSSKPVGKTDPNIYKLVDLQAGPDNGAGTDSRYFKNWQGTGSNRLLPVIESAVLSVAMLVIIGGFLLMKIEFTFIFSIMTIGLPFMLVYGLTPKGKNKLVGYGATMLSLLIKRLLSTLLISMLLLLLNQVAPKTASSYHIVFLGSLLILFFFKVYQKEIFKLFNVAGAKAFATQGILSGNNKAFRDSVINMTPKSIRNSLRRTKEGMEGRMGGAIGGAIGGAAAVVSSMKNAEANQAKSNFTKKNPNKLINEMLRGARRGSDIGLERGAAAEIRKEENRFLREGLDANTINRMVKRKVRKFGSDSITQRAEELVGELDSEINETRRLNRTGNEVTLSVREQKQLRKISRELKDVIYSKDISVEERESKLIAIEEKMSKEGLRRDKADTRRNLSRKIKHPIYSKNNPYAEENEVKVGRNVKEILENAKDTISERENENTEEKKPATVDLPDLSEPLVYAFKGKSKDDSTSNDDTEHSVKEEITRDSIKSAQEDKVAKDNNTNEDLEISQEAKVMGPVAFPALGAYPLKKEIKEEEVASEIDDKQSKRTPTAKVLDKTDSRNETLSRIKKTIKAKDIDEMSEVQKVNIDEETRDEEHADKEEKVSQSKSRKMPKRKAKDVSIEERLDSIRGSKSITKDTIKAKDIDEASTLTENKTSTSSQRATNVADTMPDRRKQLKANLNKAKLQSRTIERNADIETNENGGKDNDL